MTILILLIIAWMGSFLFNWIGYQLSDAREARIKMLRIEANIEIARALSKATDDDDDDRNALARELLAAYDEVNDGLGHED